MPFSARMRPNVFAASMNAGLLPDPEAQYTQIDLIVLMGKGFGAAGASRQGAGGVAGIFPRRGDCAAERLYMRGVRRGRACGPSLRPVCENGFFSAFERGIEARGLRRGRGLAARDHARAVALHLAGGPPRSQAAR